MTLIFENDLDRMKMNRHTKYLAQESFCLKVSSVHTQPANCSIWTTKVVGKYCDNLLFLGDRYK